METSLFTKLTSAPTFAALRGKLDTLNPLAVQTEAHNTKTSHLYQMTNLNDKNYLVSN